MLNPTETGDALMLAATVESTLQLTIERMPEGPAKWRALIALDFAVRIFEGAAADAEAARERDLRHLRFEALRHQMLTRGESALRAWAVCDA